MRFDANSETTGRCGEKSSPAAAFLRGRHFAERLPHSETVALGDLCGPPQQTNNRGSREDRHSITRPWSASAGQTDNIDYPPTQVTDT